MHPSQTISHLALIPDGNRRWAKEKGLSPIQGHEKGIDNMGEVLKWCRDLDIKMVTFWAFSTENFNRDQEEVKGLFEEFDKRLQKVFREADLEQHKVKVRFFGDISRFPVRIQAGIAKVEADTNDFNKYQVNLLIGYGGRAELVAAARKLVKKYANKAEEIDEDAFREALWTSELPDPDLIIRTSGEIRLSGLLPFQSTYSEYYFCDKLWPDFSKEDMVAAVDEYKKRKRRWGR